MRRHLIRAMGMLSGVLGVGAGLWVTARATEALPALQFVLVAAMGLCAVMVAVAALQVVRGQDRAYRRLEIAAWGLVLISLLTMGDSGRFFAPAALASIVTLGLAFAERRAAERAGSTKGDARR